MLILAKSAATLTAAAAGIMMKLMRANIKRRQRGIDLTASAAVLTLIGAGLPLVALHSSWQVPKLLDGGFELVGAVGLTSLFIELLLQK